MTVQNSIHNSIIQGDFIAGDKNVYTVQPYFDLFSNPIFLHYLGEKVSKLIGGGAVNKDNIVNTTRVIVLLFNNIIAALSDLAQSPAVYNNTFFHQLLKCKLVSITGAKTAKESGLYLAERQEFYASFYKLVPSETFTSFLDNLEDSSIPKRFETGKIISQKWLEQFGQLAKNNFTIASIQESSIKNLIISNKDYFFSRKSDEMIRIPERLGGFPFVWDSVGYLNLVSVPFDPMSVENVEIYLASEWINCYLDNYNAVIPNGMIGVTDCTLGIRKCVDVSFIIRFLSQYKLLGLICVLPFEELIELKFSSALYLREIINASFNGSLRLLHPDKAEAKIKKIEASRDNCYSKIKKIITYLYNERR